jgi:hypothetical protein
VEVTGRSKSAINKTMAAPLPQMAANRLLAACGGDLELNGRVKPFASLLRTDSWGDPLVYPANAFVVTHGAGRRDTGSHYTPKSLTEPIVLHTLEPLVYTGPDEGKPREEWQLKYPFEILALKVCDVAMGSGAFLVQTCRYLAERLVEAWNAEEKVGRFISIEGEMLDKPEGAELLPSDQGERVLIARRFIASRCLYGVDINPMAVELAKLSLWLVTMMKGRPFNFLDHALKYGDSLLGVSSVQQIENFSLRSGDRQVTFATANLAKSIEEASAKRRVLEELPSNDHTQIETKNRLHAEAEAATAKVKAIADCLIAFELRGLGGKAYEDRRADEAENVQRLIQRDTDASLKSKSATIDQLSAHAREQLHGRRPFHWAVEFPEVFVRGGFDAFVGNPPFAGKNTILAVGGSEYLVLLQCVFEGTHGYSDLCTYFLRRTYALLGEDGILGIIATNTLAQGKSSQSGLGWLLKNGAVIVSAWSEVKWPGEASVVVCMPFLRKGKWKGRIQLDGNKVDFISETLEAIIAREVFKLAANDRLSTTGFLTYGRGFLLNFAEAGTLTNADEKNRDVIWPLMSAEDVTQSSQLQPTQFIINFGGMSEQDARRYAAPFIWVETNVYPERMACSREDARKHWWRLVGRAENFFQVVREKSLRRILVNVRISKFFVFAFAEPTWAFEANINMFALDQNWHFGALQSTHHELWAEFRCSTLGIARRYTPSTCFDSFPFPAFSSELETVSAAFLEHRQQFIAASGLGLTDTYSRIHDRGEQSADIARLRALHEEMDQAVAAAYGWSDLDLGHGFHTTKQGERYTLSESARSEVLDRLLALNHQRYEEEVNAGLHDKKSKKSVKKNKTNNPQTEFKLSEELSSGQTQSPKPVRFKQDEEQAGVRSSSEIEPSAMITRSGNEIRKL